jgi:hypothetical protein
VDEVFKIEECKYEHLRASIGNIDVGEQIEGTDGI